MEINRVSLVSEYNSFKVTPNFIGGGFNIKRASDIGRIASWSLKEEALLSPKPGLVDQYDTGSHHDLTLGG